ncbi:MAG TPA: hypothetical protein VF713_13315 [Thermoanaerobaculia bacterium]
MRTDGVDHFRRGIQNVASVVDQALPDELEELFDGFIGGRLRVRDSRFDVCLNFRQLGKPCSRATARCASASLAPGSAARNSVSRFFALLRSHSRLG